jgi:tRNA (guanine37-N1)-methyltransferase
MLLSAGHANMCVLLSQHHRFTTSFLFAQPILDTTPTSRYSFGVRFDVLTLFPDLFPGVLGHSILLRAQNSGQLEVHIHDIRAVTTDKHKSVDDTPYGGGAGMLLRVDILNKALQAVLEQPEVAAIPQEKRRSILLCPQGQVLTQAVAQEHTHYEQITLICGHYEGFDERIRSLVDAEMSIGNYVLTGGELPALVIIDCLTRLLPGVIHSDSPDEESHTILDPITGQPLLEYPHYTRPLEYNGETVPEILRSGNHEAIRQWRLEQARERTRKRQNER